MATERAKATDSCFIQKFEGLPPKKIPPVQRVPVKTAKGTRDGEKAVFEPTLKLN